MVYSDPFVHLSVTDSHINYDLPRMRGNETPSDWKDRIWDTLTVYRKNNLLTGDISKIEEGKTHHLELNVSDALGNSSLLKEEFKY